MYSAPQRRSGGFYLPVGAALLSSLTLAVGCYEQSVPDLGAPMKAGSQAESQAEPQAGSLLSTYLSSGPLLSVESSRKSRAPLVGTHSADDGNEVTVLILKEGPIESGTEYLWLRMDNYCGQMGERSRGAWDVVGGELQLFPAETVPPVTSALALSKVLLLDGHLEWTMDGVSYAMSHRAKTY